MTDISEQKRREEQWRADVERVQLTEEILDNLAHPVFVQDRNLQLVAVNKVFCSALSIGADNALGADLGRIFDAELAANLQAVSRDVMESGLTASITQSMRLYGDPPRPILVHVQRVGKPGRYFVVASLGEVGATGVIPVAATPAPEQSSSASPARLVRADRSLAGERRSSSPTIDASRRALSTFSNSSAWTAAVCAAKRSSTPFFRRPVGWRGHRSCHRRCQCRPAMPGNPSVGGSRLCQPGRDRRCRRTRFHRPGTSGSAEGQAGAGRRLGDQHRKGHGVPGGPRTPAITTPAKSSLVLVAEDNEINQIVFSQILEGLGYAYHVCDDGEEVVRLWAELNPAVILMDVTLPGINGFEAARRIRDVAGDGPEATPIIGVLAQAFDRDREACYASGMNDVILKPLSPDVVEQALIRLVPQMARATNG